MKGEKALFLFAHQARKRGWKARSFLAYIVQELAQFVDSRLHLFGVQELLVGLYVALPGGLETAAANGKMMWRVLLRTHSEQELI